MRVTARSAEAASALGQLAEQRVRRVRDETGQHELPSREQHHAPRRLVAPGALALGVRELHGSSAQRRALALRPRRWQGSRRCVCAAPPHDDEVARAEQRSRVEDVVELVARLGRKCRGIEAHDDATARVLREQRLGGEHQLCGRGALDDEQRAVALEPGRRATVADVVLHPAEVAGHL